MYRVGIGYDIHRLVRRRKLILGGVVIPSSKGLLGHSDADVLLHAICDALLGACAKKDIGEHFPDSDDRYKNISSVNLLQAVGKILQDSKLSICNIDAVIILQHPSLSSFKAKIARRISQVLNLSCAQVNIKATTAEGLGQIGKGRAAAAYAIALVKKAARK